MVVLTLVVPSATPRSLLSPGMLGDVPRQCPTQMAISSSSHLRLGSFEHSRIQAPYKATQCLWPYPCDSLSPWVGGVPNAQALTHIRITWALSPMAPQVPGVTLGSPLCPWCCGHSSWRGARHKMK